MDAILSSLVSLLIEWGYHGLFISAILAGSVLPFSSELVMAALIKVGLDPTICVIVASIGNTLGGMTCYYLGHLGKTEWIEKYLKVKKEKVEKVQAFLQGKGAFMAFFAFLPFIGSVIAVALGYMRANTFIATVSMFAGKVVRYIIVAATLLSII